MNETVIKTNGLTKIYKKQRAVDNLSIDVKAGSIYGLVGENGSGKSTTLKMILGMVIPSNGDVEIFGETNIDKLNEGRKSIGSIIESPVFYPYMSAKKNLEYYRIQRGIEDKNIVEEVLSAVGLERAGRKKFKTFSLGMKQRLGIALSLMINPEILVLDEPINGLDPMGIVDLRKLLLKINRERNVTVIISSHILDELSQIATVYGFMSHGKLLKEITSEELEAECSKFLKVKVDDVAKATMIFEKELETLDYKVNSQDELYLYGYLEESEKILKVLYDNDISVKSISEEGIKLEDYYMDLIGGNKNA